MTEHEKHEAFMRKEEHRRAKPQPKPQPKPLRREWTDTERITHAIRTAIPDFIRTSGGW